MADAGADRFSEVRRSLGLLVLDVGVPTAAYYALRAVGVGVVVALVVGAGFAAGRAGWAWWRGRRADPIALLVLVFSVVGIATAFVLGSPRMMLAKEELGIVPLGGWLVVQGLRERPLAEWFRPWLVRTPEQATGWEQGLRGPGPLRRNLAGATATWGAVFLATAAVRLTLVVLLPIDRAVLASQLALPLGVVVGMVATAPWTARARRALVAPARPAG